MENFVIVNIVYRCALDSISTICQKLLMFDDADGKW